MIPKRSTSYRGSDVAAISIAQHMIPKWRGHVEFRFAQFRNLSTTLSMTHLPGPDSRGFRRFPSTHETNSLDRRPMMFACSPPGIMETRPYNAGMRPKGRAVIRLWFPDLAARAPRLRNPVLWSLLRKTDLGR